MNPIRIGNVEIKNPVILAPMAGVTDEPFRKLVKSFGAGLVTTEMIASKGLINEYRKKLRKYDKPITEEPPVSVQIFGSDPKVMAEAAKINEARGADIIDINMGCPVNKIVKSGGGSDLLKSPQKAFKIMKALVKAVKIPVTVKIRTGWDKNSINACEIAEIAEDAGIKAVTVHGRTRGQLYSGAADWKEIKRVKKSVNIPVIGNGDITTEEAAKQRLEESTVEGIAIGRGIYGRPWLIQSIINFLNEKPIISPSIIEIKEIMIQHLKATANYYKGKNGILIFRKHAAWYSKGIANSAEFRQKVNRLESEEEIISLINEFFV
jgi:tRNA-dihydrouridine synthase B